ncbi:MAG: PEP-CTERM sorting domain-containing protein [Verrucomicrobiota bacterium]|jgi:uncharacterized protein (TIGR03382 family)
MKTKFTATVIALLAGAVSGYSQGQIEFSDVSAGYMEVQVFNSQPTAPSGATGTDVSYGGYSEYEYMGNTAADDPTGTAVYAAGTALTGTGFDAQLLGAAGAGDPLSQLLPLGGPLTSGILNFVTGTGLVPAGFIRSAVTDTIPGTTTGSSATVAVAVWNNGGGLYTTLAEAQEAGEPWGISNTGDVTIDNPPFPISDTAGIESFSLAELVPEPGTMALGVMGVAALLFRRRK